MLREYVFLPIRSEVMELDIQKLRQEAYNYDTDNYGLDWPEDEDDEDEDLSWLDDFFEQYEEVAV
jgi:hypothetical protein